MSTTHPVCRFLPNMNRIDLATLTCQNYSNMFDTFPGHWGGMRDRFATHGPLKKWWLDQDCKTKPQDQVFEYGYEVSVD